MFSNIVPLYINMYINILATVELYQIQSLWSSWRILSTVVFIMMYFATLFLFLSELNSVGHTSLLISCDQGDYSGVYPLVYSQDAWLPGYSHPRWQPMYPRGSYGSLVILDDQELSWITPWLSWMTKSYPGSLPSYLGWPWLILDDQELSWITR